MFRGASAAPHPASDARFRGGLVFKAHRWLYHPTLGSRVIKKKKHCLSGRQKKNNTASLISRLESYKEKEEGNSDRPAGVSEITVNAPSPPFIPEFLRSCAPLLCQHSSSLLPAATATPACTSNLASAGYCRLFGHRTEPPVFSKGARSAPGSVCGSL